MLPEINQAAAQRLHSAAGKFHSRQRSHILDRIRGHRHCQHGCGNGHPYSCRDGGVADEALYKVKAEGRNRMVMNPGFYDGGSRG